MLTSVIVSRKVVTLRTKMTRRSFQFELEIKEERNVGVEGLETKLKKEGADD